jgi:hypothetical protein
MIPPHLLTALLSRILTNKQFQKVVIEKLSQNRLFERATISTYLTLKSGAEKSFQALKDLASNEKIYSELKSLLSPSSKRLKASQKEELKQFLEDLKKK